MGRTWDCPHLAQLSPSLRSRRVVQASCKSVVRIDSMPIAHRGLGRRGCTVTAASAPRRSRHCGWEWLDCSTALKARAKTNQKGSGRRSGHSPAPPQVDTRRRAAIRRALQNPRPSYVPELADLHNGERRRASLQVAGEHDSTDFPQHRSLENRILGPCSLLNQNERTLLPTYVNKCQ